MHLKERSHTQSEPTFTILASQSLYIILFYVFAALLSPSWDIWEKALKDLINHPLLDFTLLLHASCYLMSCLLPFLPIVSFVSCYLLTSSREESVMIQIDNYLRSLFSITSVKVNHTFLTLKTATQLCLFACLELGFFPSFFLFILEGIVWVCKTLHLQREVCFLRKDIAPFPSLFSCHQRPLPWDVSRR